MEMPEILSRLGLSENQAKLYCAALECGPSTVSELARATGLHRPVVYRILPSLVEKELVSLSLKGKRSVYVAENPEKLRPRLEETVRSFEAVLPELMTLHKAYGARPLMKIFSGAKGIRAVFDDMLATLKKGEVFYRYDSHRNYQENKRYLPDRYIERACRTGDLHRYIITNETTFKQKQPNVRRYLKMVPGKFDLFAYNISQLIYADKVAFIDYTSESAYIIENPAFARFQRQIFMLLFEKL